MDKYVGKKLDGRYEIRELIGIGGMANVYRCYDTVDDREVAIKILKDEFLNNEEFIRRFKNESKAIAVLSHPNIVKVYDVSFGDMIQYIVMEYIDGITLKEYINQQKVLSWKETVHLVTQVLKALSHAHSKGVVHRDIKPQNMMLLSDGTIKVTDFGIARFSNSTRTMTEQAIGSVHYIAPEQAKGDITDGKTDIYSIGVMMYEMLTGKLPFDGDNAVSVALMHLQVVPDTPRTVNPSIPEGIEEITLKAMQKQPADRYQSAQDMLSDIDRFRMNPSVRFEYKYFTDKQPTKYIDAVNKGKSQRAEEFAGVDDIKDDENMRHSLMFPVIIGIIIAVCLALVVCIPYGLLRGNNNIDVADVDVPDLIGMSVQEVEENPEYSFNYEYEYVYTDESEIWTIIDQTPSPDSKQIKANGTIKLKVNAPQTDVAVPSMYGDKLDRAKSLLNREGFYNIETITVAADSDLYKVGSIVCSYPEQGTTVSVSDTIYLYISGGEGNNLVTLTNTIGYSKDTAVAKLESLGFEVSVETIESTKTKDTVLSQSPLGGDLPQGSAVILFVSKEPPDKTVNISVDLPDNVSHPIKVAVKYGTVVDTAEVQGSARTYNFAVSGKGTDTVRVYLDDQLYREYRVDYDTGKCDLISSNEYVDAHTPATDAVNNVTDAVV